MVYRVRLLDKLKPNNYPKVYCVNVADRWRYKWYNKYVQKIQNKNVQMLYCYRGGKQYDHKKQHYFKFKN